LDGLKRSVNKNTVICNKTRIYYTNYGQQITVRSGVSTPADPDYCKFIQTGRRSDPELETVLTQDLGTDAGPHHDQIGANLSMYIGTSPTVLVINVCHMSPLTAASHHEHRW